MPARRKVIGRPAAFGLRESGDAGEARPRPLLGRSGRRSADLGKDVGAQTMSLPIYDEHRDSYAEDLDSALRFSGKDHAFFTRRKADALVELAERYVGPVGTLSVLDVGC